MARRCDLTGLGPQTGNNVSHAKNRTKRRFLPNLCNVTLRSDKLGQGFRFKVAASTLRSLDHMGGLDVFLARADDSQLSPNALKVKRKLAKMS
jgi:large subunit ribosomal protein L28